MLPIEKPGAKNNHNTFKFTSVSKDTKFVTVSSSCADVNHFSSGCFKMASSGSLESPANLRTNSAMKYIFYLLFPLTEAEFLLDLARIFDLFTQYKTLGPCINQLTSATLYFLTWMTVLQSPMLVELQPLKTSIYGSLGYLFAVCTLLGFSEIACLRVWLYTIIRKHRLMENIEFIQLLQNLDRKTARDVLYWSKFLSVNFTCGAYAFVSIFIGFELVIAEDFFQFAVGLFHLALYFHVSRVAQCDVIALYAFALAGCEVVLGQTKHLRHSVSVYGQFLDPMFAILGHYYKLVESVRQLNSLSRTLMLASKQLVIPLVSVAFFLVATPANDLFSILFKLVALNVAIVYAIHGYILIAALSRVDTMSKRLYIEINSLIARKKHTNLANALRLNLILQDLSSHKSHLVAREFGGSISQMDAFNSAISTLSVLTLLFSLRATISI